MQEEFEDEVFRFVPGYDNYSVTSHGRIRNNITDRILKPGLNGCGYYTVSLYKDGVKKTHKIHRLVAIVFVDNPENKGCVDHIDNNKKNNHVLNLRWCTSTENSQNRSMNNRNTSGVKGVTWDKRSQKWYAQIMINGKQKGLGYFVNIEDAKKARMTSANIEFNIYVNSCERW